MEELTRTHISFYKTAIFSAVIIAGLTAQALLGPYLYLGYPQVSQLSISNFLMVILTAVICGFLSAAMCRVILKMLRWKSTLKKQWKVYAYVIICAFAVAGMALLTNVNSLNSGKELMTHLLFSADKHISWYTPFLRIAGSIASFTTGAAGGVFAPALSTGATVGSVLCGWLHLSGPDTNTVMLAGMVAFLTGITRSPFTSAILVLEMTDGHSVIFHLMLAALIANLSAYFIDRHSFYDHLKVQYIKDVTKGF